MGPEEQKVERNSKQGGMFSGKGKLKTVIREQQGNKGMTQRNGRQLL